MNPCGYVLRCCGIATECVFAQASRGLANTNMPARTRENAPTTASCPRRTDSAATAALHGCKSAVDTDMVARLRTRTHTPTPSPTYTHMHTHSHAYACTPTRTHARTHARTHTHTHLLAHTDARTCTHTYTHTHTERHRETQRERQRERDRDREREREGTSLLLYCAPCSWVAGWVRLCYRLLSMLRTEQRRQPHFRIILRMDNNVLAIPVQWQRPGMRMGTTRCVSCGSVVCVIHIT